MRAADPFYPLTPGGLPSGDIGAMAGLAGFLVQSAALVGVLLVLARRWNLPAGAVTLVLVPNAVGLGLMRAEPFVIPVALVAALLADVAVAWLRPSLARPARLRVLGGLVPLLLYSLYFAYLLASRGLWWSVHLWTGAIVLAATTGYLVSFLVIPPTDAGRREPTPTAEASPAAEPSPS